MNRFISLFFVGVFGIILGATSYKYKLYPAETVQALRNFLIGDPLKTFLAATTSKPRNTVFDAFHPKADVVMIGDSNTQGAEWREIFPDLNIANRGIGGDRSDDVLRRMDTILLVHPTKAFVMIGFNDFSIKQKVDAVFSNYQRIVEILREHGIEVYIQSTLECTKDVCGEILDNIRKLNVSLRAYAQREQISFIDINDFLASRDTGLLRQYTSDGIHLVGNGYVQWEKALHPYLRTSQKLPAFVKTLP
jgi:lysophospholipase L1-like esterase